jgi:arginine/lysine/ornithine decarboxylase
MLSGHEMLDATLDRARRTAARVAAIPGLTVLRPDDACGAGTGFHQLDETKLLIGTRELAVDARAIVARLNRVHGVQPELSGPGHVLCISTIGNTESDMDRLVAGFAEVATYAGKRSNGDDDALIADILALRPEPVLTPREAFFAADETVPLSRAAGRVAADAITPYPPGIPLVMPGELLSPQIVELLRALRTSRNPISASDPELNVVKVVA